MPDRRPEPYQLRHRWDRAGRWRAKSDVRCCTNCVLVARPLPGSHGWELRRGVVRGLVQWVKRATLPPCFGKKPNAQVRALRWNGRH